MQRAVGEDSICAAPASHVVQLYPQSVEGHGHGPGGEMDWGRYGLGKKWTGGDMDWGRHGLEVKQKHIGAPLHSALEKKL